jgi:C4-dicarboxylate-specific signal transduction histidine kinase
MESATPRLLDAQLAFIGRIIAGVSHEFKNHLSVTKELTGLLDDLLSLNKEFPGQDRYAKISAGIEERVRTAAEMASHLGRFAHRMDSPLASFNVNEVVGEIVFLMQRFARLKNVALEFTPATEIPSLHSNPSLLQLVIFSVTMPMLAQLEKQSVVRISAGKTGDRVELGLQFEKIREEELAVTVPDIPADALQKLHADYSFTQPHRMSARAVLLLSPISPGSGDNALF